MSVSRQQAWTQEAFFDWAEAQEERYEFDGFAPVAMVGGTPGHSLMHGNIVRAVGRRLRAPSMVFGPDAGLETVGTAVRYPDALITCSPVDLSARTVPGVVVVFEVLSPTSGQNDRIIKVREYAAVPSIRRYVIAEYTAPGLTVLSRSGPDEAWTAQTLTEGDTLSLPEVGIAVPVAEIYAGLFVPPET